MKWIIALLFIGHLGMNQDLRLDDSLFYVYPIRISPSDTLFSAKAVSIENTPFEIDPFLDPKYTLLMIVRIETFGFRYYQLELARGKGLVQRKSIIINNNGQMIKEREHKIESM